MANTQARCHAHFPGSCSCACQLCTHILTFPSLPRLCLSGNYISQDPQSTALRVALGSGRYGCETASRIQVFSLTLCPTVGSALGTAVSPRAPQGASSSRLPSVTSLLPGPFPCRAWPLLAAGNLRVASLCPWPPQLFQLLHESPFTYTSPII